ncbi:UNVERIFIED_CONTAM: diguanylate cyclase (GGDEF)-like protein [Acetivibrio alkalicellulosi]
MKIKSKNKFLSTTTYKRLIVFIILACVSLAARIFDLPFSYGINFTLANITIFIILKYYGLLAAFLTSVSTNIFYWYFLNGSPYSVFFTIEIVFIAIMWKKSHGDLFLLDIFYWIIIGAPGSALLYYLHTNSIGVEGAIITSNNIINGLLNVLTADIILSYIPVQRVFGYKHKNLANLNKIMVHITITAVLAPFLAYTLVDGWLHQEKLHSEIYNILNTSASNITKEVNTWDINDLRKVRLRSPLHLQNFETIINKNPFNSEIEVFLVDMNSNVYVTNNPTSQTDSWTNQTEAYNWKDDGYNVVISNNTYKWMPAQDQISFDLRQWSQAFYINIYSFEEVDLQLLIKVPLYNYTISMWNNYMNKFLILLLFFFASVFISILISRFLSRDLHMLTDSSTGLPDKLKRQETIKWPNTSISQINTLAANFQIMSDNLSSLFTETKIMNNQLLLQTKELESSKEKMKQLAYYDNLTNLPNRLYFNEYLEELIKCPEIECLSIMFIDLNRFKQVNDTLGHEVGDLLIIEVSKRLKCYLSDDSFVARLGGDEFVITFNNIDKPKTTKAAIEISNLLSNGFKVNDENNVHELYISASIGISLYPDDAVEKSALLKNADLAMYAAKETGENTYMFFSELSESNRTGKLYLEQSLRKALVNNELLINYQPKIGMRNQNLTGIEALIRWNHPIEGLIPPSQFIPLAEETGIINQIGEWVLTEACKQNKEWHDKGYVKTRISVNLSLRQFQYKNFVNSVIKSLEISKLKPEYLELEITEGFLIKNADFSISILNELRLMGVHISIDDFGTGYSSLSRLKELPIDSLKIDKSFVKDITTEKNNIAIVEAIIQLAHSMGLQVIAEGVEKTQEWNTLKAMGCDEIQGYLISKPVSKYEFETLLKNFSTAIYTSN